MTSRQRRCGERDSASARWTVHSSTPHQCWRAIEQQATAVPVYPRTTSHVRWVVLGFLTVISFVAYLLRTNMSVAGERIMTDAGLTQVELGWVLAAFAWGYAIFQLPGGLVGDMLGGRRALALVTALWGVLNLLVALVPAGAASGSMVVLALSDGRGPGAALSGAGRLGHRAVVSRHRVGPAECAHQLGAHAGRRGDGAARGLVGAGLRLARLVRAHRAARARRRRRLVLVRQRRARPPPCDP
ncbi:MAG: MFS transporter, partial [Mycobacterium sp.]|nr:MFS transporter [Mycobacterium sp.]